MAERRSIASTRVRPFEPRDFDAIEDIYALSKLDELRNEDTQFELLPLRQDEKRLRELMESRIFVYDEGEVQGYGAVLGSEIRAIFVHPEYRGKGIGKRLLEHLSLLAGGDARLYVAKSNAPAVMLYQNYGFKVTREFKAFYNGVPVQAIEMERSV